MTPAEHANFTTCVHSLRHALKAVTDRPDRDFDAEVEAVWVAACEWAVRFDQTQPTFEEVAEADTMAAGHVDWSSKFPLYVAEVVFGLKDNWLR